MIDTIPNSHPEIRTVVRLETPYAGACPRSGEPQPGSWIAVAYEPTERLLELHGVQRYLARFAGGEAIDLETVAQQTARDCAAALGVAVEVEARYLLRGGLKLTCRCLS